MLVWILRFLALCTPVMGMAIEGEVEESSDELVPVAHLTLESVDEALSFLGIELEPEPFFEPCSDTIVEPLVDDFYFDEEPEDLLPMAVTLEPDEEELFAISEKDDWEDDWKDVQPIQSDWIVYLPEQVNNDHEAIPEEQEEIEIEDLLQVPSLPEAEDATLSLDERFIAEEPILEERREDPINRARDKVEELLEADSHLAKHKTYIPPKGLSAPGFFVSPRKVTNEEYGKFVEETHYTSPNHWIGGKIPTGLESAPVVNVSYKDALIFAVWSGQRLPSSSEWERARVQGDAFEDIDDAIYEWTSTPYMTSREGGRQPTIIGRKAAGGKRIVFSPSFKDPTALSNLDRNTQTGFRCISYQE